MGQKFFEKVQGVASSFYWIDCHVLPLIGAEGTLSLSLRSEEEQRGNVREA